MTDCKERRAAFDAARSGLKLLLEKTEEGSTQRALANRLGITQANLSKRLGKDLVKTWEWLSEHLPEAVLITQKLHEDLAEVYRHRWEKMVAAEERELAERIVEMKRMIDQAKKS